MRQPSTHDGRPMAGDGRRRIALVYEEMLPVVFGYCRSRLPLHDAEDVTADVFRSAVERIDADPTIELTSGWFLTAARHRIVDRWRRSSRWSERLVLVATEQRTRLHHGGDDDPTGVLTALDGLPDAQRAALMLHHVDGHTVAEVAEMIGRSSRAVESLLARGRRNLLAAVEAAAASELAAGDRRGSEAVS